MPIFTILIFFSVMTLFIFLFIKKYKIIYRSLYILTALAFIIFIIRLTNNESNLSDYHQIKDYSLNKVIHLVDNRLTYEDNTPIEILDDTNKTISSSMYPIYLKSLSNSYIIVYSYDKDKEIPYHLYFQQDYEMYDKADKLVILDKNTGEFHIPRVYDLIGSTIQLNNIITYGNSIFLPVNKPYNDEINYYYQMQKIIINNKNHYYTSNLSLTGDRKLIKFVTLENEYISTFDNGEISYEIRTTTTSHDQNGTITIETVKKHSDILDNFNYVKAGYFTTHKDLFYVLGNDLEVYTLKGEMLTKVGDISSPLDWDLFISKLS